MSKTDATYAARIGGKPYNHPCLICHATHRDEKGQDSCIANLPGVLHACCGHGEGPGYAAFENGVTLRGYFEMSEKKRADFLKHNAKYLLEEAKDSVALFSEDVTRSQKEEIMSRMFERREHYPLVQREEEDDTYTEGVAGDGVAILKDGVPLTITQVLDILNGRTRR